MNKRVQKIGAQVKSNTATFIHRQSRYSELLCAVNNGNSIWYEMNSVSRIGYAIDNVPFFNPALPGTLTDADLDTGTDSKKVHIVMSSMKMDIKANYLVPIMYACYFCTPKTDNSFSPIGAMSTGVSDIGAPSATSEMLFPSDVPLAKELWNYKLVGKGYLEPGKRIHFSHTQDDPNIWYDPAVAESHTDSYNLQYKPYGFMFRVWGDMGHDTTGDLQGKISALCDTRVYETYKIEYPGGADMYQVRVEDGGDTFTTETLGATCNLQEAKNQVYALV